MRAAERAPGGGLARALVGEAVGDAGRVGVVGEPLARQQREAGGRELRRRPRLRRRDPVERGEAVPRQRRACLGHLRLERAEPDGVADLVPKQPVAVAHRLLVGQRHARMTGQKAQRQPVEKPPPPLGRVGPQPVHRRRQPDHPGQRAERELRLRLVVDAGAARLTRGGARLDRAAVDHRADAPARADPLSRLLGGCRAAQPAARRQHRQRLEDVGLAGPVRAEDRQRPVVEAEVEPRPGPELRQRKLRQRHTRIGMTT